MNTFTQKLRKVTDIKELTALINSDLCTDKQWHDFYISLPLVHLVYERNLAFLNRMIHEYTRNEKLNNTLIIKDLLRDFKPDHDMVLAKDISPGYNVKGYANGKLLIYQGEYFTKCCNQIADQMENVKTLTKPYYAMDVANYVVKHFIDKKQPIVNMILSPMLYYLQAYYLVNNDCALFSEPIEKWGYGPVISSVYDNFNSYGATPIPSMMKYVLVDSNGKWHLVDPMTITLQKTDQLQIDSLVDKIYNKIKTDPFQLIVHLQHEALWQKDKAKIAAGNKLKYSNDEIKAYFKNK